MFAAGGLIWANVHRRKTYIDLPDANFPNRSEYFHGHFGFPDDAFDYVTWKRVDPSGKIIYQNSEFEISYMALALDVLAVLLFLSLNWLICEWWIRRRAARKES